MLVVRVELWPFGQVDRTKVLGTAVIGNDGTGDSETGNYLAEFEDGDVDPIDIRDEMREGRVRHPVRVTGHPRAQGPWALLRRALNHADLG